MVFHLCTILWNSLDIGTEKDPLSVYMVFPYMDHDLAGLLENERVKLQPSHIKLYMKQLLEGTEYMHRVRALRPCCMDAPDVHSESYPAPGHEGCQSSYLKYWFIENSRSWSCTIIWPYCHPWRSWCSWKGTEVYQLRCYTMVQASGAPAWCAPVRGWSWHMGHRVSCNNYRHIVISFWY